MRPETWPASSWNRGMTGWIPSAKGRCRSATGYLRRSARGTAVRSGAGSHQLCRPHDMARNIDEQTSTRVARLVILRSRPRWRTAQLRPTRSPNMGAEQHIWAAPTAFPFRSRRSTLEASSCWDNMPAKTKQTAPSRNRGWICVCSHTGCRPVAKLRRPAGADVVRNARGLGRTAISERREGAAPAGGYTPPPGKPVEETWHNLSRAEHGGAFLSLCGEALDEERLLQLTSSFPRGPEGVANDRNGSIASIRRLIRVRPISDIKAAARI